MIKSIHVCKVHSVPNTYYTLNKFKSLLPSYLLLLLLLRMLFKLELSITQWYAIRIYWNI